MSLAGKISIEVGIHSTAEKLFDIFSKKLHHVQNVAERVHGTKLHQGDDWHTNDSVKHWTYTVDGKTLTCYESFESIDEKNKTIICKIFGEDIDKEFKVFRITFQAIDKNDPSTACIKWTIEYERVSKDVHPPHGYLEMYNKIIEDIDDHLVKEQESDNK
ncbi:hypothetical protein VNO78_07326 [Psophocarpus tetragonolobus]|uniref:Bet v I/Major latex protein domain-containing protein n=1 Tax=Psophocarpus tetragonolobus TaxID=3891 RepID=A0AAN9ST42_PSOTE